jgi:transcriptional regulator of stress and heat shock response
MNLTDFIEDYLKKLLALSSHRCIDIRRQELAQKFACVPSQINYVLSSRFSPERGYLVESRRGGSGYIRIYRVEPVNPAAWEDLLGEVASDNFEPVRARHFLRRVCEEKLVSRREALIVENLLRDDLYAGLNTNRGEIRMLQKKLFTAALEAIFKESYLTLRGSDA